MFAAVSEMYEIHSDEPWFIKTRDGLEALRERLSTAAFIGIDTEFERRRTYFAELCLVQLAVDDQMVCVDPIAIGTIEPLVEALDETAAPKILHAARQDLEVLTQTGGALFKPLLDTQIAAGLAGYSEQIGYADLTAELLGITLDKSQTRTDWRKRPLSAAQIEYAIDDVRYLKPIMERLQSRLIELDRHAWLEEDCLALTRHESYEIPVEDAWQRVKGMGHLSNDAFGLGVALASWRETTARKRNLPRRWVIKDGELIHIAAIRPANLQDLQMQCALSPPATRRYGAELIAIVNASHATSTVLRPSTRQYSDVGKKALKLLGAQIGEIGQTLGIAPSLIMTRREMERLVGSEMPDRIANGWRGEVAGDAIAAVLEMTPGIFHE